MMIRFPLFVTVLLGSAVPAAAAEPKWVDLGPSRGDEMLEAYFEAETAELTKNCLSEVQTLDDWLARKDEYRRRLFEMLGLDPLPEKTRLKAMVTGKVGARRVHRREPALPVAAGAVRDRQSVRCRRRVQAPCRRSSTCAATEASRRTASAMATRRATSTTAAGSPGTATSA